MAVYTSPDWKIIQDYLKNSDTYTSPYINGNTGTSGGSSGMGGSSVGVSGGYVTAPIFTTTSTRDFYGMGGQVIGTYAPYAEAVGKKAVERKLAVNAHELIAQCDGLLGVIKKLKTI